MKTKNIYFSKYGVTSENKKKQKKLIIFKIENCLFFIITQQTYGFTGFTYLNFSYGDKIIGSARQRVYALYCISIHSINYFKTLNPLYWRTLNVNNHYYNYNNHLFRLYLPIFSRWGIVIIILCILQIAILILAVRLTTFWLLNSPTFFRCPSELNPLFESQGRVVLVLLSVP